MVDLRVPRAGLAGFRDADDSVFSVSEAITLFFAGAGEAGMVLNLFLASPDVAVAVVPLVEDAIGRALRAVVAVFGLALLVVGLSADFAGLTVFARVPICLSIGAVEARIGCGSVDKEIELAAGEREDVGPDIETRLAAPPIARFLFSSTEPVATVLPSSNELLDALSLCPELAAVAAVTLVGGRRAVELAVGRVGGLLRPLPGVARDAEDVVDMGAGLGVVPAVRLAVVKGRFGGIPFRLGELGVVCRSSSFILPFSSLVGRSSVDNSSSSLSCEGAVSFVGSSLKEAISVSETGQRSDRLLIR